VQVNTFTWYQIQRTAKKNLHQIFLQVQKIEDSGKMEFQKETKLINMGAIKAQGRMHSLYMMAATNIHEI
jgi:hypothetical protein